MDTNWTEPIYVELLPPKSAKTFHESQTLEVITPEFRFQSPISIQGLVESLKKLWSSKRNSGIVFATWN